MLPTDASSRKATPIYSGVLRYFPDAIEALIAHEPPEPHVVRLDNLTPLLIHAGDSVSDALAFALEALGCLEAALLGSEIEAVPSAAPGVRACWLEQAPRALAALAELSRLGNEQHNPGSPLHWDRAKSSDELDACARHLCEASATDSDGVRHLTKAAWRALAWLQKSIEAQRVTERAAIASAERALSHRVPAPAQPPELHPAGCLCLACTAAY